MGMDEPDRRGWAWMGQIGVDDCGRALMATGEHGWAQVGANGPDWTLTDVGGCGWVWTGVNGYGWAWIGVDGHEWGGWMWVMWLLGQSSSHS